MANQVSPFVIMLDIDGVLYNTPDQHGVTLKAQELFPDDDDWNSNKKCSIAATHFFNKRALENLDYIIEEIEKSTRVWIVISSNWREYCSVEYLKTTLFKIHNFSKNIEGKTPDHVNDGYASLCKSKRHAPEKYDFECRASQIQYWLNEHPEIIDFAVLDDCDDHLKESFGDQFFRTDYGTLLDRDTAEKIVLLYKEKIAKRIETSLT